ncbi:type II toxin-antitoxin system RelE/ParE family toxin [Herbidospora solisilvae]|uniref:type II toxin-antitoxin system RelE/ParE family toxin n=1 Tax=Herbidospora solisilvae TaxID=2696284 RepID=UPI001F4758A0|nr:type II toxin-antitoxin system RelE/ParE family toxin [Herbidospora solisilvae]
MAWGEVELEPEVDDWLDSLSQDDQETAVFYVDLLAERGVLLGEPYTRQLHGKLRELRFHLSRERCGSPTGSHGVQETADARGR